jgi:hypothetical protein
MYLIRVRHADGFDFKVECRDLNHARLVEVELAKRFPAFDGYAVGAYVVECTTKVVCL